jgi:hypothetical protein
MAEIKRKKCAEEYVPCKPEGGSSTDQGSDLPFANFVNLSENALTVFGHVLSNNPVHIVDDKDKD